MTAYTVLRFTKLKSWGAVGGAGSHNARLRSTPNADPEAMAKNRFLVGSPSDDLTALCQARLGGQKIRRNAVYAVEGVMSASPGYFDQTARNDTAITTRPAWSLGWMPLCLGSKKIRRPTYQRRSPPG